MKKYIVSEYLLTGIVRILAKRLCEELNANAQKEIIEALCVCGNAFSQPFEAKQETEEDQ